MSFIQRVKKSASRPLPVRFLLKVISQIGTDDVTVYSASISYYAFLAIFPLIIALVGIAGYILPSGNIQSQIVSFLQNNLPGQAQNISSYVDQAIRIRGVLSVVGILVSLWAGSNLISTLGHAINRCWDVRTDAPFYIRKPRDIGLTVGFGILLIAALSLIGTTSVFNVSGALNISNAIAVLIRAGAIVLSVLLLFAIFLILFKVMPNTKTYWRYIWFGAAVTALLFSLGNVLLLVFFKNFTHYSQVYGPVASIVVLLVWIYYSALIVLIGAEIASEHSRLRRGNPR
jgi:membrane protein